MNLSNKEPQSRPLKSIDDEDVVNYFQQSINFYHNQNIAEIVNNIDSSDLSDLSDFEVEIKPHIAVQKKDRDIHDQKKTKISQQKGKSKVVNESEDEFQLNRFKPNRKMLEIQQNESMIDKKDTKHRNYTKEKYQNKSSQQYEHFGKAKKNPLQLILPNPTIDTTKHQTNNLQINAVIRNHKPAVVRNHKPAVISNYQPAVIRNEPSFCERICRLICLLPPEQRINNPIYQNPNTSPQKVQRTNTRTYQDRNTSPQKVQRTNTPIYQNPNTSPQKVQRTNARTYQGHNKSRQNLNISRLDGTNIINTSRLDGTNHDISQYSYRQNDSSRPLGNHKSSFEIFGLNDPDKLVPQKPKKDIFRYF